MNAEFGPLAAQELKALLPPLSLGGEVLRLLQAGEDTPLARNVKHYLAHYDFDRAVADTSRHNLGYIKVGVNRVAVHQWQVVNAKATVVVVHGLFDHVGLFIPLIANLVAQGLNVVAYDQPEHGLSSGEQGELRSFSEYSTVFDAVLACDQLVWQGPRFAVGQSTGGAVILRHALQGHKDLTALVALAPLLRCRSWSRIRITQALLGPFIKFVPRHFSHNSHDEAFCQFLATQDPFQPKRISTHWVQAMIAWAQEFTAYGDSELPLLTVQGTRDSTVDAEFNLPVISVKFPNNTVCWIEGGMHHLVAESPEWRDPVFACLNDFIAQHIAQNDVATECHQRS